MTHRPFRQIILAGCLLAAAAVSFSGCIKRRGEKLYNSLEGISTIVVAPMMNLSTNPRVDLIEVTNNFTSELQQVEGLTVVPIGRVYDYLAANGMATVGSPQEARALGRAFKAQAVLVAAVTEYDAFNPPRMGLAVQLYAAGPSPAAQGGRFDPVRSSRSGVPFAVGKEAADRPRDQISRVFSGKNSEVEKLARQYARERQSDANPYGWRHFIVNQHEFQRLCSYGIIREMLGKEGRKRRWLAIKVGPEAEKWPK
ncbi:MAG: hypothetical protein GWP05_02785 [Anaerolineaceae bacterium]|nr:hypothetical protein [Anaerolineaceae bacterium]